jgi:hypothetical protein
MSKLCFSKRARARLFESRALEQLAALAVTVRAEVDAELRRQRSEAGGQSDDAYRTDRYQGPKRDRVRSRRLPLVRDRGPEFQLRPGEIHLRDFIKSEVARCGKHFSTISFRIKAGEYPGIEVRHVNKSFQFVTVRELPLVAPRVALPGEMPLRQFAQSEAERQGVTESAIYNQIRRGLYSGLVVRPVDNKLSFVRWENSEVRTSKGFGAKHSTFNAQHSTLNGGLPAGRRQRVGGGKAI